MNIRERFVTVTSLTLLAGLVGGCASDPLALLPPLERGLIRQQSAGNAPARAVSVQAMLAEVRGRQAGSPAAQADCDSQEFVADFAPGSESLTPSSRQALQLWLHHARACHGQAVLALQVGPARAAGSLETFRLAARRADTLRDLPELQNIQTVVHYAPQASPDTVTIRPDGVGHG